MTEELLPVDFEARHQVELLQHVEAQALGLVHDHDRAPLAEVGSLLAVEGIAQDQARRVRATGNTQEGPSGDRLQVRLPDGRSIAEVAHGRREP
jgi:hypothetical protein